MNLVLICLMTLSNISINNSFALTDNQKKVIKLCYDESKFFGLEEIIPVMSLVESSAGVTLVGDNETSFGILQVKLTTAKWFLEKNEVIIDSERLKYLLTYDNKYCIIVACSYFNYLLGKNKGDYSKAVLSYNVGLSNVRKNGLFHDPGNYLVKFNKYKKIIEKEMNYQI